MTALLRQSTTTTIQLGPFVDATDGVTPETGLTPAVEVSKQGAAFAARNSATAVAHDAEGMYRVELNATDTNTLGRIDVKSIDSTNHVPVFDRYLVVPAAVYDALVAGTGNGIRADVQQIAANAITATSIQANAITSAKVAASAIGASQIGANAITSAKIATDAIGAAQLAANAIGASELAADAVTEIQSGLATSSALATVDANVDAILVDTGTSGVVVAGTPDVNVAQISGDSAAADNLEAMFDGTGYTDGNAPATQTAAAAIETDTQDIQSRIPAALVSGRIDASVGAMAADTVTASALAADAAAEIADAVWDEDIVAAHGTADTAGLTLSEITKRAATLGTAVLDGSVVGQILDDGTATYDRTTDSLQAIADSGGGGPTASQIADAVWDEDIVAAHGTGDTAGLIVSQLTSRAVTFNTAVDDTSILGQMADDGTASFDRTTDSLQAIADSGGGGPTAAQIADAVWDEASADHVTAGSTGAALGDVLTDTAAMQPTIASNLDATVSSRAAPGAAMDLVTDAVDSGAVAATAVTEIQSGLATAANLATVDTNVDTLLVRLSAARAALLDEITAARLAELDAANLPADVDTLLTRATEARLAELDAANLPADVDTLLTRATEARLAELDAGNLPTDVAGVSAAVAALNDIAIADVQTALTSQGLTAVRAALLDNLDEAVSAAKTLTTAERAAIATAVGALDLTANTTDGSLSEALLILAAIGAKRHVRYDNFVYSSAVDANGDTRVFCTSFRIRVFATAAHHAAQTPVVETITVTNTADGTYAEVPATISGVGA